MLTLPQNSASVMVARASLISGFLPRQKSMRVTRRLPALRAIAHGGDYCNLTVRVKTFRL